ncbi:MAG TPA: hypothetical protein VE010_10490 [Thermoanaerobaculia bacterium]|nr:hypothetical protein [Thermoanaerobaculia bacterium]
MIYRKRGSSVRWENGTFVRLSECGVATEEGALFTCAPDPDRRADVFDAELPVAAIAAAVQRSGVECERLVLVDGVAEHEYGERTWTERTQRLHLALTHGRRRVLIDQATFDVTSIERIGAALARCEAERIVPAHIRLAPNVAAALLPWLVGRVPPGVRLLQSAGGVDGRGNDIAEAEGEWPNWYRPSYRVRPERAPLNLRLEAASTDVDAGLPIAIALLAPVTSLALRVLVEDGSSVYPATVDATRILAAANERIWYPYGAGSFGAEMML